MAQNMVNIKIVNKNVNETRRFTIDESVISNFVLINEKVQTTFPNLRGNSFKITWKDNDGDFITIKGDEDLVIAYTEMKGHSIVLYVENQLHNHSSQSVPTCPFGEMFDLKTMHALARQYLEPLMGAAQGNKAQMQLLADLIKNAAVGIFGECPARQENCKAESESQPSGSQQAQPPTRDSQPTANRKIAEGLTKLQEMGFNNDNGILQKLLEHFDGNVESVVKILAK